ncbi:MAG: division plane positioning ATPase MipZ [Ferrovibrionaceae bacterium]
MVFSVRYVFAKCMSRLALVVVNLATRFFYWVSPGLAERVIYRELFLNGLTLLDLDDPNAGVDMSLSHVAARQEVRGLINALRLPGVQNAA